MEKRDGHQHEKSSSPAPQIKRPKSKFSFSLSEKQAPYLLIFPALILMVVIALLPVARSFWISIHDVRLNDPNINQIRSSYAINMERYVDTIPLLKREFENEIRKLDEPHKGQLTNIKTELEELITHINTIPSVQERYDEVDELLFDFSHIPQNLRLAKIDEAVVEEFRQTIAQEQANLIELRDQQIIEGNDLLSHVDQLNNSIIEPNFIGLSHYKHYLNESRMWVSLWNTIVFTLSSVALQMVFGLMIALIINTSFKGRGLVRASVLIPWAIPTVVIAMIWRFLYDGQNGIIAKIFASTGVIPDMGYLLSTKTGAMISIIVADTWKTTPFVALLLLAGLLTIPSSLYEAAKVDGASKVQQFFSITLPLMKPAILVALLFRTLDAFRVFDLIYVLTGGGPANSTESISIYAYKVMFGQLNFGAGSALSVIVFICVAIISAIYIKILGSDLIESRGK